jgi:hypothetical protein
MVGMGRAEILRSRYEGCSFFFFFFFFLVIWLGETRSGEIRRFAKLDGETSSCESAIMCGLRFIEWDGTGLDENVLDHVTLRFVRVRYVTS